MPRSSRLAGQKSGFGFTELGYRARRERDRADPAASEPSSVKVSATLADGFAYRVERRWGTAEERFVVVAPSGARLFFFADLASGEAEVQSLRRARPAA